MRLSVAVLCGVLAGLSGVSHAGLSLFANIEKERGVMVSRDALREFVKKHQLDDNDFRLVHDVRGFYGSMVAIDVYPSFLNLSRTEQEKVARKILDAWSISLPKHLGAASVSFYVKNTQNPFLSRRFLRFSKN